MKRHFVSWDSDDEKIVRLIVESLRKRNPAAELYQVSPYPYRAVTKTLPFDEGTVIKRSDLRLS